MFFASHPPGIWFSAVLWVPLRAFSHNDCAITVLLAFIRPFSFIPFLTLCAAVGGGLLFIFLFTTYYFLSRAFQRQQFILVPCDNGFFRVFFYSLPVLFFAGLLIGFPPTHFG